MKKLTTTILSTLGVVSMAFGLSACGHQHTLTKTSAVDATCTTAGNSAYYACDCGKFFSDEKGATEIQENSWVIEATGHNPQKVDATVSTCAMNGNSEYYACACGKYFSDAQGQNEIAANSWKLPLLSHQYDSDVSVIVEEGKAYFVVGCDCSAVEKTEIPNAIIVNSTQTAQQALDNATNNTVIVLNDADYGVLYLRKTDSSELVENDATGQVVVIRIKEPSTA
ncbi:MAG: hypothetical protein J6R83_02815 [Clostridia bacterium]|nr:hypothetical protein [Clostridia bacterium]